MQALMYPNNQSLSADEVRQAEASGVELQRLLGKKTASLEKATLRVSLEQPGGLLHRHICHCLWTNP